MLLGQALKPISKKLGSLTPEYASDSEVHIQLPLSGLEKLWWQSTVFPGDK